MPYLTETFTTDEFGVVHPTGVRERTDLLTNPLAIINRTIPMVMYEGSITFILDRTRKYALTLDNREERMDFMFEIMNILNPKQTKDLKEVYNGLSEYAKDRFVEDCISVGRDGLLITTNGLYCRWEAFNTEWSLRDSIIEIYKKYPDIYKPYHIFVPKKKWGRDIYIGDGCVGYQYIMMLKQSGAKGFSVRSSGAIGDESLPEKDNAAKHARAPWSTKPIRFGE